MPEKPTYEELELRNKELELETFRKAFLRIACLLAVSLLVFWSSTARAQNPTISMSDQEQKWLSEHRTLRLGVGVAFPPFMWVEKKDGQHIFKGMVSDYVDLLSERLGVDMQIVFGIPFKEALDRGRIGRIDFFPCLSKTLERSQFLLFTKPYLSYPLVIITRESAPIVGGVEDLKGKPFAVVKHLFVYSKIQNEYPNLDLNYVFTGKVEENLEAVSLGRADACIINLAAASYYIQKKGLTNLRIAASVNWKGVQLSIGVRKDWPILQGIIGKALASISQEEKDRISQRWIRAGYEPGVAIGLIWRWSSGIGLGIAVLFSLFFFWNRRLQKEIVEKEKAETETFQQKEKAERYLSLAGVMFIGLDRDGNVNIANKKACNILECNEIDIIGQNWFDNYIPQRFRHDVHSVFRQLMDGSVEPVEYYENPIITKSGKEKHIAWHNTYMADDAGKITGILSSGEDITEKKLLEAQLLQSQKMEAVGTLAGGIAHDFNNILAVILGNAELAADDIPPGNPAGKSLKAIHQASLRAKDMVRQLLAFSRKSDEETSLLNMTPIIKESMKMLRSAVPTSIEFKLHISGDACNILGDAAQINQIMMNLVTNASHAMSEAGGLLEVTLEKIILPEETPCFDFILPPGPHIRLKVRDTGKGIEPKILARIFEPYFTTKEVGKGTGMGLSVVHGIAKRHDGGILVESTPGEGTVFEIYFPALEKMVAEEEKPEGEIKGGSESILFVDDEESMVDLNHQRLTRLGYEVKSTTQPVEALEWFKADPDQFDVIITDMTMPRMTGDRLAVEVLKIQPNMPVIICTGYSERMSAEKAETLGVSKYIEKPIDLRNLAASLREVFDKK
jgi:two-component system, cell cycle sensor histidine kinase and response regulator CckA